MKTKAIKSFLVSLTMMMSSVSSFSQGGWEWVGNDPTPGDMRVPLCILEYNGYIFFGDDHVGIFRIKEPVTDTSSWEHFALPNLNIVYDLIEFDDLLWCCTDGSGIYASDDNGETWQDRSAGLTHTKVYTMTVCQNVLFCGTYHGGIFRLDNGTGTWSAVNTGFAYPPNTWYALELGTIGEIVYLYTVGIGMYYTTDLGEGWYPMNNMNYDGGAEVHDFISHGGYLMIPADYLGVMRSSNGGQGWDFCNDGITSQMSIKCMAATDQAVFVASSDSGIFMSLSNGDHWFAENLGYPWSWQDNRYATAYSMEVIGEYLYLGFWFEGMRRAKLSDLYAGHLRVPEDKEPQEQALDQNRPNPFRESTVIRYKLNSSGPVKLTIIDSQGKMCMTLVSSDQGPGEYSVVFNPAEALLPGGIYYYRLVSGTLTGTRKMLYVP